MRIPPCNEIRCALKPFSLTAGRHLRGFSSGGFDDRRYTPVERAKRPARRHRWHVNYRISRVNLTAAIGLLFYGESVGCRPRCNAAVYGR
jgi:hypothetical protein